MVPQPLQRTRGALMYYQNAVDSKNPNGFLSEAERQKELLNKEEEEKEKEERERQRLMQEKLMNQCRIGSIKERTIQTIMKEILKKGWIGLRNLKINLHKISEQ